MQKSVFKDGSFVLHQVYIPESTCKFSVWFDCEGNLLDVERFDSRNRCYPATINQIEYLRNLGPIWKDKNNAQ